MSLNNEQCKITPALIDLNPAELKYYPYTITLDKCNGSCNALSEISDRICAPDKTENVNLNFFYFDSKNKWIKKLRKNISRKCKCKFYGKKCNSNETNNNKMLM